MVKRSVEQDLRTRNFEARNGRIESNMLVKNQREQRRVLKGQGDCWQWQGSGQCTKGHNCIFWPDENKRAQNCDTARIFARTFNVARWENSAKAKSFRGRSPSGKKSRLPCKHHLKGTCANPSCEKWRSPECLLYKSTEGCKFGDKCAFAHRRVEEQPSERFKRKGDKSVVALLKEAKNLGCVFQDVEPPRSSSL